MRDLYLVLREGIYCVHGTVAGKRIRVSCRTDNEFQAKTFLEDLRREHIGGWRDGYDNADVTWKAVAATVNNRHRQSAKARGIPFQIKTPDVYELMESTDFRCAVSGIPFSKKAGQPGWADPWAPSIDRIENRHGYLRDNIRVVSVAANIAMNQWGYDVLLRLAKGVVRNANVVVPELTQNVNKENVVFLQAAEK
jgi:hypothetical protein